MVVDEQKTLLLVEDEAIVALSEERLLAKHGFVVLKCFDGQSAVDKFRERDDIDLVLMDIDLGPGLEGTEAARQILAHREVPVVFLTSHAEKEMVDKVRDITRYGYVLKSSGEFVLVESIAMAFELFQARKDSERHANELRATLDSIGDGVITADVAGRITRMNPVAQHLTGWPLNRACGEPLDVVFDLKDLGENRKAAGANDLVLTSRDGHEHYVAVSRASVKALNGSYDGTVVVFRDVTEEVRMRAALEEREERFRTVLEHLPGGVFAHDLDGNILLVNEGASVNTGYTRQELLTMTVRDIDPSSVSRDDREDLWLSMRPGETRSLRSTHVRKDGSTYETEIRLTGTTLDGHPLILATAFDLTPEIERETRYATIIETVPDGLWIVGLDGRILDANPAALEMSGYSLSEMKTLTVADIDNNEDPTAVSRHIGTVLETGYDRFESEHRRKDGSLLPVDVRVSFVNVDQGQLLAIIRDISDEKEAAATLRETEERFSLAMEASKDGIWDWNMGTDELYVSPGYAVMLGYKPGELQTHIDTWKDNLHPEDYDKAVRDNQQCIDGPIDEFRTLFRMRTKTGDWRWIRSQGKVVNRDAGGHATRMVGVHTDVTEHKNAEEELKRSVQAKNDLMKELNHRVKNNLALVSGLIDLKESSMSPPVDLTDLRNQLLAIQAIHEKLSQSDNGLQINAREYLRDIVTGALGAGNTPYELDFHIPSVELPAKQILTVGLIVNEVATNALKHGFDSENRTFGLEWQQRGSSPQVQLRLWNTGRQFPEDTSFDNPSTLGLRLISSLAEQLDGTVSLVRKPVTTITVAFPLPEGK